jgi:DNA-binding transcriptional LysR family regulator
MFDIPCMREVNVRGLDLNLLGLLDLLLRHASVTRAAAAANLSQPAMSRALGRLRALFGDPLLVRGSAGFVLTPRAAALQAQLGPILSDIIDLVRGAEFDPAEWTGRITIAATDHQTILLLPSLMARLAAEAPRLDVKVVPFVAALLPELQDGRIDLSFSVAGEPLPRGIACEPLYQDSFVTLLRRGHPAIDHWDLNTFAGLDHVLVTILGDGRGVYDDDLQRLGLTRHIRLTLPHFYAAMAVVARSDLVVTLPSSLAVDYIDAFELAALLPPVERPPFTVTALWPEALDSQPSSRWLRSLVREEAAGLGAAGARLKLLSPRM